MQYLIRSLDGVGLTVGPGLEPRACSVLHVLPCVERNVLSWTWTWLLWFIRARPLLSHWLCDVTDRRVLNCHRINMVLGAGLLLLIIIQVVWTHAEVPVMWPAAKLVRSDWSQQTRANTHSATARAFLVQLDSTFNFNRRYFDSLFSMSTANFFGDRNDVPDLLKSLADYPFSFPTFDDTGKNTYIYIFQAEKQCWNLSNSCSCCQKLETVAARLVSVNSGGVQVHLFKP